MSTTCPSCEESFETVRSITCPNCGHDLPVEINYKSPVKRSGGTESESDDTDGSQID